MKVSNINARMDTSGKHNDRNFDLSKAPHINPKKTTENKRYTYNGEEIMSFRDLELEYYHNHFEQALEKANAGHVKARHADRVKTMEMYYSNRRTMPEDKILQIGDINEHASKEDLWACALEYKDRFEEKYGDNCRILDMALHMDEATPHVHVRRVWFVENEQGNEVVNQTKALEQLGILPPDPEKPIGRYNNPKMTMTQTDIELFKGICFDRGLDIDMDGATQRRTHVNTKDYKISEHEKEREYINKSLCALARFIEENPYIANMYGDKLKEAEQVSLSKRNEILISIMIDTYESLHGQVDIANKYELMQEYVEEHGLLDDYNEWKEEREEDLQAELRENQKEKGEPEK